MLRPKRFRRFGYVRRFVQIERGAAHAMDDRPEAHLVYNPQWAHRQSLVFGRAWDHECLRDNKKGVLNRDD